MTNDGWSSLRRRASVLAAAAVLLGAAAAYPTHSGAPPPPPPGHGQLLIRLVRPAGDVEAIPGGEVTLETVELHRAGAAEAEGWVRLPLARPTFPATELIDKQVWVTSAPVAAGQYDQVRVGRGRGARLPLALNVVEGQWKILTLDVRVVAGRSTLQIELRRARVAP